MDLKSAIKRTWLWKHSIVGKLIRESISKFYSSSISNDLQQYGGKIIYSIEEAFSRTQFTVFPMYGTLLGFVRERGLIQWDVDIDFGIVRNKDINPETIKEILESADFKLISKNYRMLQNEICIDIYTFLSPFSDKVHIDLYFLDDTEEGLNTYWYEWVDGDEFEVIVKVVNKIKGFKHIDIYNQLILIPDNYDELLTSIYGEWQKPKKNGYYDKNSTKYSLGKIGKIEK